MELLQTIKRSKIRFDLTDSTIPTRLPKEVKDLLYDIADVAMYIKAYKEIGGDHEALPFGRIKRDEVLKAKAALDELSRKVKQKDKLRRNMLDSRQNTRCGKLVSNNVSKENTNCKQELQDVMEEISRLSSEYYHLLPKVGV